jgi:hypothetical protein
MAEQCFSIEAGRYALAGQSTFRLTRKMQKGDLRLGWGALRVLPMSTRQSSFREMLFPILTSFSFEINGFLTPFLYFDIKKNLIANWKASKLTAIGSALFYAQRDVLPV